MAELAGQKMATSEFIAKKVQELASEVNKYNSEITGLRAADPTREAKFKEILDQVHKTRGRPLYYPYFGTGCGNGVYVELEDGSVKLDLLNGIGINLFGHGNQKLIAAAIRGSLQDVVVQGNIQPNGDYLKLGKKLVEMASKGTRLKHAWFSTCGTMANESAIKMCRQKKGAARHIIALKDAFAGRSTLMAEVTDNPGYREGLPRYDEVHRIDFYNRKDAHSTQKSLSQLKDWYAKFGDQVCAFMFEPIPGEGGYRVAPREFFIPLLDFCREHKIPVLADEVQTFTRTGELLAMQTLGLGEYVDITTVAKTLQNGATLFTEEMAPKPGLIAGTFAGSSATLAAGLETLRILDEEGYLGAGGKIVKVNQEFMAMLNRLGDTTCKGLVSEVEGLGLMVGFTPFDGSKAKVDALTKALFKNGMVTYNCGHDPYRIRFLIPAVITTKDIQVASEVLEKSLHEVK